MTPSKQPEVYKGELDAIVVAIDFVNHLYNEVTKDVSVEVVLTDGNGEHLGVVGYGESGEICYKPLGEPQEIVMPNGTP